MKRNCLTVLVSLVLVAATAVSAVGCAQESQAPPQPVKDVTSREAFNLIQENEATPDFVILDVRTPGEFSDGHIENAININYRSEDFRDEISKLERSKEYLIYCRTGNRSREALTIMTELGFRRVYHLAAGITEWIAEGYSVTE